MLHKSEEQHRVTVKQHEYKKSSTVDKQTFFFMYDRYIFIVVWFTAEKPAATKISHCGV